MTLDSTRERMDLLLLVRDGNAMGTDTSTQALEAMALWLDDARRRAAIVELWDAGLIRVLFDGEVKFIPTPQGLEEVRGHNEGHVRKPAPKPLPGQGGGVG